jgi:thymidylate synthase (FAD)
MSEEAGLGQTTKRTVVPAAEEILGSYFPVLDHGFVSLVDYMGGDAAIEQAARVSYGAGARTTSDTRGLIRYMHRHKHTSPSEMVELKFHCSMPIFVARQWIRHRTANVSEVSGRYSILPQRYYTPEVDQLRAQSQSNKQGREGDLDEALKREAQRRWQLHRDDAAADYDWLATHDFARELARIDLPLSTYTKWYWKIDLHNLLHFLTLRVDSHSQWEIQQYGRVMAGMLKRVAPLAYEAWIDYEVCGARFSRMEMRVLRSLLGGDRVGRDTGARYIGNLHLHGAVYETEMERLGMSKREVDDLYALFEQNYITTPDFELDLSTAKTAEFYANRPTK